MPTNYLKSIDAKMDVLIKAIKSEKTAIAKAKTPKTSGKFIDNGDGTISDPSTGLMWAKEGSKNTMTFKGAERYCQELKLANHKDWRLPTVKELVSIVDYEKRDAAIDSVFACESNWYWSGTGYAGLSGGAWVVSFYGGGVDWSYRSDYVYVRPVRQY